jgi:hypothetical protein
MGYFLAVPPLQFRAVWFNNCMRVLLFVSEINLEY